MNRSANAIRNIIFGVILKMYQLIMPFIMRSVMIYFLGIKYLGLNGLFSSVLSMLNLAELGIGWAMIYFMYEPIAKQDTDRICALLNLYKKYYKIIGTVIAGLGLLLMPFLPNIISEEVPANINIYIIYILNLLSTVFNYWLFAYKSSILTAHQRVDITSKMTLFANFLRYTLQIIVLAITHNYYYFLIVILFTQIIYNILVSCIVDKYYPQYKARGMLEKSEIKEINGKIKDVFSSKFGAVLVNSADPIVISAFLGITVLAVYQNYFSIITGVIGFVGVLFSSIRAGIGNSIVVDESEKIYRDFNRISFISIWIIGWCSICFLCLYQHFMTIWMGADLLLSNSMVILFSLYFFCYELMQLFSMYKDAAGVWHGDRFRPMLEGILNICLNLVLVQICGLYGILLSTIISMSCFSLPWLLHNLFVTVFKRSIKEYLMNIGIYLCVTVAAGIATYYLLCLLPSKGIMWLAVKAGICCLIPNIIFLFAYRKLKVFEDAKVYLKTLADRFLKHRTASGK